MTGSGKLLLISPPYRSPERSDLGVSTLRALAEQAGIATSTLYGTHLFPHTHSDLVIREQYSSFFFAPHLYPDVSPEECVAAMLAIYFEEQSLYGSREEANLEAIGIDPAVLRERLLADIAGAGACLDRCTARALADDYDVVGFSCGFETQITASLALAARIKAARPAVAIVLGGAACFDEPAHELLKVAHTIDAVCYGEGERVLVPLVRALMDRTRRDELLAAVPGIDWRDRDGRLHHCPPAPPVDDLDELPIPFCDDFTASLAESRWQRAPIIHFETARGCWWGVKHLCSFCGLNGDMLNYRKKSPERAFDEIRQLHRRYPDARQLFANDTILDMGFLTTLMPRLARWRAEVANPPRLFWEIKANLRRGQVRALADAGVEVVQPGIESFSDDILDLMKKGSTALGQIQHIKWCYEDGLELTYSVLVLNPGERASWLREMAELVPFIDHLPAPRVAPIWVVRFSPYFNAPEQHGITNLRAKPFYRLLYRGADVDPDRLAYAFDYDHPMFADDEHRAAVREILHLAMVWATNWRADKAYYIDDGGDVVVVDQRTLWPRSERLTGLAAQVFRCLDQIRSRQSLQQRFADVPPALLDALLEAWQGRRWVCRDRKDRYLGVLPRKPGSQALQAISRRTSDSLEGASDFRGSA